MQSIHQFIITPVGDRYDNIDKETGLVMNTDIANHKFISRNAKVLSVPSAFKTPIKEGMEVIVHHNIFRRWYDMRGNERNGAAYISEDKYLCQPDLLFMYKDGDDWKGFGDFCFIAPVKNKETFKYYGDKKEVGIVEVTNSHLTEMGVKVGDTVKFIPDSEYSFVVDGQLMYRMRSTDIYAKLEDGVYEKYSPTDAQLVEHN